MKTIDVAALSQRPMLDIAKMARAGEVQTNSAWEALAMKFTWELGAGWHERTYGGRVLTDLEKTDRDNHKALKDELISALKAAGYSNPTAGYNAVRDWASGKRGKAQRDPNANKTRTTAAWLAAEMPKWYRRLHKAEDVSERDMVFTDAMTAWLEDAGIDPRKLLD